MSLTAISRPTDIFSAAQVIIVLFNRLLLLFTVRGTYEAERCKKKSQFSPHQNTNLNRKERKKNRSCLRRGHVCFGVGVEVLARHPSRQRDTLQKGRTWIYTKPTNESKSGGKKEQVFFISHRFISCQLHFKNKFRVTELK